MCLNVLNNFLCLVGAYALAFHLYDLLKTPITLVYYYTKKILGDENATLIDKYGKWAAITGSTDGIGMAYARELAFQGLNIILISRNRSKLEKVAQEIEADFYVKTKIIVADFTQQEACKHVEVELSKTPVRILVNNVSQTKSTPNTLDEYTFEDIHNIINTNMGAVCQLSRYFINRLKSFKETGLIVNVSSGFNYTPVPKVALYSATKTFVSELTLALQAEAGPYGIEVQLLKPFLVVTKINSYSKDVMRGSLFIPDPVTYARSAVYNLGKVNDTTGFFYHALQCTLQSFVHWRLRFYCINECVDLIISRSTNGCKQWKIIILRNFIYLTLVIVVLSRFVFLILN